MLDRWCQDPLFATLLAWILCYLDECGISIEQKPLTRVDDLNSLACLNRDLSRFIKAFRELNINQQGAYSASVLVINTYKAISSDVAPLHLWDLHNERLRLSHVSVTPSHKADVYMDFSACPFPPLYITQASSGKGRGLYSSGNIVKGAIVCCYCGEIIKMAECMRRQREIYDPKGVNYVLTVREIHPVTGDIIRTNVDATDETCGGFARYINHSCDPNCVVEMHRLQKNIDSTSTAYTGLFSAFASNCEIIARMLSCEDASVPKEQGIDICIERVSRLIGIPVIKAIRHIYPGEELTFDYGSNFIDSQSTTEEPVQKRPRTSDSIRRGIVKRPCLCGSSICRGFLPAADFE